MAAIIPPPMQFTVRRRTWLIRIAAWFHLAGETEIAGWLVAQAIVVRAA